MVRNLLGMLFALVGAAAAVWSPFFTWYGGRLGRDYRVGELFTSTGITGTQAGLWTGLFLPMLVAAAITVLAALLRSRLLVTLAALIVLGFAVLWMVRQGQEAGTLTVGAGGLGAGVGYAFAGGVLLLLGALVMRGRRPTGRRRKSRGRRARVDDSEAAASRAVPDENHAPSEPPPLSGPFEPAPGPHGAYREDHWQGGARGREPYFDDDSTPEEEWDPWAAGRPGKASDEPADRAPQGPQHQPGATGPEEADGDGPEGTRRLPRRPDDGRGGPYG